MFLFKEDTNMLKVDLHCHTRHSDHPSEWFLKRVGTAESYTEPEYLYKKMVDENMDFVCITDHNSIKGGLELLQKYPEKVILGVESTTYFPEDGCKVHILLFDITERQFERVEELRSNIYDLREYIIQNNIAYSVAHATYSVNSRLSFETIEKLIALFDVFEARNGIQAKFANTQWENIIKCLKLHDLERVCTKHNINPISPTSWIKGITAGSDDHAGLFLGKTYTMAAGTTKKDFVNAIKNKETTISGRHNSFESLAFSYYKVAYDFSKTKRNSSSTSLIQKISGVILNSKNRLQSKKQSKENFRELISEFVMELSKINPNEIGDNIDNIFNTTATLSDEFLKHIFSSIREKAKKGDIIGLIEKIASAIPSFFVIAPFFTSVKHISQDKELFEKLNAHFSGNKTPVYKKILWFSDTLVDLNGVSETLREIGWKAHENGYDITIATCLPPKETHHLAPNTLDLPLLTSFPLPYYEKLELRVPAVLKSLRLIKDINPDEIYISSPGPIGLFGLLAAKFFGVPSCGVYHTDFAAQAKQISDDNGLYEMTDSFMKWFYNSCSSVKVSTKYYADMLASKGCKRVEFLPKGIDTNKFYYKTDNIDATLKKYHIESGVNLMYAGRVSADKSIDFLISVFKSVKKEHENINLIIAGDGPLLDKLKSEHKHDKSIIFTGRIERAQLVDLYSACDLFVFPSITDTFGMVVLEAQACSLPAVVSDVGGPQEVILNGETGVVLEHNNHQKWTKEISKIVDMCKKHPDKYSLIRQESRRSAIKRFNWSNVLKVLVERDNYNKTENLDYHIEYSKTKKGKKVKEYAI